jgi:hypothetical protein
MAALNVVNKVTFRENVHQVVVVDEEEVVQEDEAEIEDEEV